VLLPWPTTRSLLDQHGGKHLYSLPVIAHSSVLHLYFLVLVLLTVLSGCIGTKNALFVTKTPGSRG